MTDYVDESQLREYIGSDTTNFAGVIGNVCTVASRFVEHLCDRTFTTASVATAQYYAPDDWYCVEVNDFHSTSGLIVATDDAYDGTYSTTWTIDTDFTLEPVNPSAGGVTVPYNELVSTGTRVFPQPWRGRRKPVKVTALWGWASVPDEVFQATLVAAAWIFKMKDAPDGFVGLDGWGPRFYKENPAVGALLAPFMQNRISVA